MPSPCLLHDTWGRTPTLPKGHGMVLQKPQPQEGPPQGTQWLGGPLLREMGATEAPSRQPTCPLRSESGLGVGSALTLPPNPGCRGLRLLTQPGPEGASCPTHPQRTPPLSSLLHSSPQ